MRTLKSRIRKRLSLSLVMVLAFLTLFQSAAFGEEQTGNVVEKPKPFPSQSQGTRAFTLATLNPGNIGNDFVQAQVGSDGRFNAGLKELNAENWFNIIYAWPSGPGTSFTTVRIDGGDYVYGNYPDGQFTQTPINKDSNTVNESAWKTGDISVKQVLQPGINPATGQPDALQMKYIITNTGNQNHDVGLRMMFDTMVNYNDAAPFKVPTESGVESINFEKDYIGDNVPAFWQVFNNFNNPDISAQYTMRGRGLTAPDRFTIARWGGIVGTKWDYQITPGAGTGDSAVGMWWNPKTLAPGEQKIITTYYGRPGVGGDQALVLSGRKSLTYDEWSSSPFNLISYFTNNTSSILNDVRLELEADAGITLVDNDSVHQLGTVNSGVTNQSSWKLKPNTPGKHTIVVKAFANSATEPFATAQYEVEALEPIVPPNITLGGNNGTTPDGTPMSGRMSPLTVNASFDNPRAIGVTLIATDGNGDTYQHDMESTDAVDWKHTFTPSQVGLWESPMTIKVIPRYADGTTGTPLEFPIVLIDPSGYIFNGVKGEDWRLPGATVILQYFDPDLETWVNMSEEAYPGRLSPITNPLISDNDGRYAWDVAAGDYRVVVSRPGFSTTTSREVPVTEGNPVTDLHVALTPTDIVKPTITSNDVSDGGTYTDSVTINFSTSDDEAGVRNTSYKIDGNSAVNINGSNGVLPAITSFGKHTVILTAVDQAGNEAVKVINFEIKDSSQPVDNILDVVTAAINKSKEAQSSIETVLSKINSNVANGEIQSNISQAKQANADAKVKIARLKELLSTYSSPTMPDSQLDYIRKQVEGADIQNTTANNKLAKALEFLAIDNDYSRVKARVKEAQTANKSSIALIEYTKGNLIIFSPTNPPVASN
ncbi:carboxypeptidase regulatory-like domain-containing protein [Neobacillus drentensis]|uniref:carboxypeptidase-like regulatory domain-containing protein n=1 Tax=Neobacillus drentensis TaxID=220684 RepID=UPI003002BEF9